MISLYQSSIYRKNQVWEWLPPDRSELFVENCKKYSNNESLEYYKENPVKYSFNNFGFRTPDDFNEEDEGNVFLGCSETLGIGHHLENTWAYKLNKDLGGKFWNLSQSGSGIQTAFRLLYGFKDYLKVKNIFHLAYFHPRFEFIHEDSVIKLSNWHIDDKISPDNEPTVIEYWQNGEKKIIEINSFNEFYVNILSKNSHKNFLCESYIYALKSLANEMGCNYHYLRAKVVDEKDDTIQARDLMHSTIGQQNSIYKKFKKL